ncbi:MAG: hypothetical protein A2268_05255 [Candidatus Raymondbacteria bacterium RifOxyA12_full_50_37]|nr:MAG: hypothetical protein A2268_05255 [Candidatus Raymondbacteria bacterium RifOxyA12_full_50_37]OGJ88975.1 MAG: hypothetical protein A2248_02490 [Candidatus Raymondbacteria bacterium RIFOXYA2_FULL_49_16]OGJ97003.1 MAG: hypothetical protein A2453_03910 [Candidatus Raymondbacteria bacterium RIFOXYC2_FULL_50_21]OGK02548.1 MAG: hypothetical protein A2487_14975 [Candidatus Raymondbacteria bacterium RifOxyC12_full_50_8]OGK04065.1 MAG: hypothetical protein A2350_04105 [Candidatus Raymondbacteria b
METLFIVLIILFGFALIMADLLFIPGGIVAAVGGLFIVGALVGSYKVLGKQTTLLIGAGSVALACVLAFVSVKFQVWNKFVVKEHEDSKTGFSSFKESLGALIGKKGVVATPLRPGGAVFIEGKKYDAVSEEGFVDIGKSIEVIALSEGQVKVRQTEPETISQ